MGFQPRQCRNHLQNYANVASVDVIDDLTAKVNFKTPTLAWYVPFVGTFGGSVLPGHIWNYDAADEAPTLDFRTSPIGTGPLRTPFRSPRALRSSTRPIRSTASRTSPTSPP